MGFEWSRTDATMGDGFLRIACEQVGKAINGVADIGQSPSKRIHEARRRCKKLRGLLRLVRPGFPEYDDENGLIRDAARHLSEARDAKVVRQTLAELMAWAGRPEPEFPDETVDERRELEVLARFGEQLEALQQRVDAWPVKHIDPRTIERGLARSYRAARRAMRHTEDAPSDLVFHEWRKHAKYHWHHLGLLEQSAPDILESETRAAGALADLLGLHHDLAVLRGLIAEDAGKLGVAIDVSFVADAATRRQVDLEGQIGALGRQVFAETPNALRARFAAYLKTWKMHAAAA